MRAHAARLVWIVVLLSSAACLRAQSVARSDALGLFTDQSDIGISALSGAGSFDAANGTYSLISSAGNTWFHVDGFHFLRKQASGDMVFTADIAFPLRTYAHEPSPHRKGILMFRQTLDAGSAYAGLAVHGSGMTSLQYRRQRGADTEDIELNIDAPKTVRIEKRGDVFTLYLSTKGEPLHPMGASITLHLEEPFYVGLGAVSHDLNTVDKIEFSRVTLESLPARLRSPSLPPPAPAVAPASTSAPASAPTPAPAHGSKTTPRSTLFTIGIEDQNRRAMLIRSTAGFMQAPNWTSGNTGIYVRQEGHIARIPYLDPPAGGTPQLIAAGKLVDCAPNFGVSPDGKSLAMSCARARQAQLDIYVLPLDGGTPRKVTSGQVSSYFHAWSPEGSTIAFTRGGESKADIFTISAAGGADTQLTRDTVNDGPDFSPDGKFIYFDSSRSGSPQIWRMHPDGSASEQITDDNNANTSPHLAPDGKHLAFLSRPTDSGAAVGPAAIKVIANADGLIRTVTQFQGNRDSFSMYGWGNANHLAFISYQTGP